MPKVCVSDNLSVAGGRLGLAPWSVPRVVKDNTTASIGDGPFGQQTTLPGKLMIIAVETWTNTSPVPHSVLLRVQRPETNWVVSNPNVVQLRDQWTHVITSTGEYAPDPDPSSTYRSAVGGGVDLAANSSATPLFGRFWQYRDTHITEDLLGPVPPGYTLEVQYRRYLWTPPPWADNASLNAPLHEAYCRGVRIIFFAMPELEGAV